jgi:hypothetical protein
MDQNTPPAHAGTPAAIPVEQALKDCVPDRLALNELIARLIKDQFTDDIRIVDEILKHTPGDGSVNLERLRQSYKNRILNNGNKLLRELPKITQDFIVTQVFEYRKESVAVTPGPLINTAAAPSLAQLERLHNR